MMMSIVYLMNDGKRVAVFRRVAVMAMIDLMVMIHGGSDDDADDEGMF